MSTAGLLTIAPYAVRSGKACRHGMMARGNVIIDTLQCRSAGGADVTQLVSATAATVPRQQ